MIYYDSAYINHSEVARRCETLEELLRAADVVSIHTTHDEASHHLMNATTFGQSEFRSSFSLLSARFLSKYHLIVLVGVRVARRAAVKQGSYFVNAARGELVDETALIDALTSGHLAGAGIDVVISQPL